MIAVRLGGDEFLLWLPAAGSGEALILAENVRAAFSTHPWGDLGISPGITGSFGIAERTDSDTSFYDTLKRADAALYNSKLDGRDRVAMTSDARDGPHAIATVRLHTRRAGRADKGRRQGDHQTER